MSEFETLKGALEYLRMGIEAAGMGRSMPIVELDSRTFAEFHDNVSRTAPYSSEIKTEFRYAGVLVRDGHRL